MAAAEAHRMQEVVKSLKTKSDKIRALDDAGFARTDIANFLEIRYQHVRNVLTAPRPARRQAEGLGPVFGREATSRGAVLKTTVQIGAGGRVVIPADMRVAMGVTDGDTLIARVVDGEFRLLSKAAAVRKAQTLVRQFVPASVSLVDQLIEERRAEAKDEGE